MKKGIFKHPEGKGSALAFGLLALLFWSVSGGASETATRIGAETCLSCHSEIEKHVKNDVHATVNREKGETISSKACESCHGPGSLHADSGGKRKFIQRNEPKNCLVCHTAIQAQFKLQHHHPVPEGRMSCSDCHGFHGSGTKTNTIAQLQGERYTACFKCHKEVKGPFVFEHDAMRDGCQSCHNVHGSVQDKMLTAGQTTTCLRCHYDVTTNPAGNLSGGVAHGSTASTTGAAGGDYDIGSGDECVDHHRAPHGSNIWRTLNR